jgi:ABC exporter DevB family membrane fusion protein
MRRAFDRKGDQLAQIGLGFEAKPSRSEILKYVERFAIAIRLHGLKFQANPEGNLYHKSQSSIHVSGQSHTMTERKGFPVIPRTPVTGAIVTLTVAILGLGFWQWWRLQQVARSESTEQLIPAPEIRTVTALGWIEPQGETIAVAAPPSFDGSRIETLLVSEGDRVRSGQTIATLDNHDRLKASLERARDNVRIAEARRDQVAAGAKTGEIDAQSARTDQNRAELQGQIASQQAAIATLESQLAGERATQLATLDRLQAELDNAEIDCQRYEELYAGGAVPAQQRDSECLKAVTARERTIEARAELDRILSSRSAQIAEARSTLDRTVQTLQDRIVESDATLDAIAEVRPEDLALAEAELAANRSALLEAQTAYNDAFVRAPQDGQILKIHVRAGESARDSAIVDLGQTQTMYAVAEVYDSDIGQVNIGQTATVTATGFDQPLRGTVDQIGFQVQTQSEVDIDPAANLDARIVEVRIRLDAVSSRAAARSSNRQVTVTINLESPKG